MFQLVSQYLETAPDKILVLAVFGQSLDDLIASVVAIYAPHNDYVLIVQVYSKSGQSIWIERIYAEVVKWTQELGLTEIRAELHRESKGLERRWGFNVHGIVVKTSVEKALSILSKKNEVRQRRQKESKQAW